MAETVSLLEYVSVSTVLNLALVLSEFFLTKPAKTAWLQASLSKCLFSNRSEQKIVKTVFSGQNFLNPAIMAPQPKCACVKTGIAVAAISTKMEAVISSSNSCFASFSLIGCFLYSE